MFKLQKAASNLEAAFLLLLNMSYSFLALGDSYTIGEAVLLSESFPYQTVQILRQKNISIAAPEIIAKTGWTTDELLDEINKTIFLKKYDIVSLLIGVNNQYRERDIKEYELQFEELLQKAINLSGNNSSNVIVVSIPDWSITPFAEDRDKLKIALAIDQFNEVCRQKCIAAGGRFLEITNDQRLNTNDASLIANDGLHPSALEYSKWANKLAAIIESNLSER